MHIGNWIFFWLCTKSFPIIWLRIDLSVRPSVCLSVCLSRRDLKNFREFWGETGTILFVLVPELSWTHWFFDPVPSCRSTGVYIFYREFPLANFLHKNRNHKGVSLFWYAKRFFFHNPTPAGWNYAKCWWYGSLVVGGKKVWDERDGGRVTLWVYTRKGFRSGSNSIKESPGPFVSHANYTVSR